MRALKVKLPLSASVGSTFGSAINAGDPALRALGRAMHICLLYILPGPARATESFIWTFDSLTLHLPRSYSLTLYIGQSQLGQNDKQQ
jgi:hypothetical protein